MPCSSRCPDPHEPSLSKASEPLSTFVQVSELLVTPVVNSNKRLERGPSKTRKHYPLVAQTRSRDCEGDLPGAHRELGASPTPQSGGGFCTDKTYPLLCQRPAPREIILPFVCVHDFMASLPLHVALPLSNTLFLPTLPIMLIMVILAQLKIRVDQPIRETTMISQS